MPRTKLSRFVCLLAILWAVFVFLPLVTWPIHGETDDNASHNLQLAQAFQPQTITESKNSTLANSQPEKIFKTIRGTWQKFTAKMAAWSKGVIQQIEKAKNYLVRQKPRALMVDFTDNQWPNFETEFTTTTAPASTNQETNQSSSETEDLESLAEELDDLEEQMEILSIRVEQFLAQRQNLSDEELPEIELSLQEEMQPTINPLLLKQPQIKKKKSLKTKTVSPPSSPITHGAPQIPLCPLDTNQSSQSPAVVFNEIVWMGSTNSANDEWIELKNVSTSDIYLLNWQILNQSQQIKIILPALVLKQNDFLLLERTDDHSVLQEKADIIYTGALNNTNETVYLFNSTCQLQDTVQANPNWPTGDNATKKTMERSPAASSTQVWQTSADPNGTPKKENSLGDLSAQNTTTATTTATTTNATTTNTTSTQTIILITEVQIETASSTTHDFIELFNPSTSTADLSGWQLKKKSSSGKEYSVRVFPNGTMLAGQTYFLWLNSDYASSSTITADTTSTQTLASNNSLALFDRNDHIIDQVSWGSSTNPFVETTTFSQNPSAGQNLSRKFLSPNQQYQDTNDNAVDFELSPPTPKAQNPPTQTFLLPITNLKVWPENPTSTGAVIALSWTSTTDRTIDYLIWWSKQEITTDNATTSNANIYSATTSATSLAVEGLQWNSIYYLAVQVSDDSNYSIITTTTQTTSPVPVSSLIAIPATKRKAIDLIWLANGSQKYLLKQANQKITESPTSSNETIWDEALTITNNLIPKPAGEIEIFTVEGLNPDQTYFFALKSVSDNATSLISNIAKAKPWPDFQDNNDGTVTDLAADLIWVQNSQSNITDQGNATTQPGAISFLEQFNATTTFASSNDWRIPNFKELSAILLYASDNIAVPSLITNTKLEKYWTASQRQNDSNCCDSLTEYSGWYVDLTSGQINKDSYNGTSSLAYPFLAVRGPSIPDGIQNNNFSLQDNNDNTITDQQTNLMWLKTESLPTTNSPKTWPEAIKLAANILLCQDNSWQGDENGDGDCANHNGIKYDGWRLPNMQELIRMTQIESSLILNQNNFYWSATIFNDSAWQAGNGKFIGQITFSGRYDSNNQFFVALVRDNY